MPSSKELNVKRLSLNRQAAREFTIRPAPKIPDSLAKKFPELSDYNRAVDEWSKDTGHLLRSIMELREEPASTSTAATAAAATPCTPCKDGDPGPPGPAGDVLIISVMDGGSPTPRTAANIIDGGAP